MNERPNYQMCSRCPYIRNVGGYGPVWDCAYYNKFILDVKECAGPKKKPKRKGAGK